MSSTLDDLLDFSKVPPNRNKRNKITNQLGSSISKRLSMEVTVDHSTTSNQANIIEKINMQKKAEELKQKQNDDFIRKQRNKKWNLDIFLTRELDYQQKKQYDIEAMRNKQNIKEMEELQDKPKLSKNTIKIAKTLNNAPLYTRTNDEIIKHKNELNKLKELYEQEGDIKGNSSSNIGENTGIHSTTLRNFPYCNTTTNNIPTTKTRNKSTETKLSTNERINTWLTQQTEWDKMVKKKNMQRSEVLNLINKEEKHTPQISTCTENKLKTLEPKRNLRYKKMSSATVYDEPKTKLSVYDRLYTQTEDSKMEKEILAMQLSNSFVPALNKSQKYKNVTPRYYADLTSTNEEILKRKEKNIWKKARSIEKNMRAKKDVGPVDIMTIGKVRKADNVEHWSTSIMKITKSKSQEKYSPNEILYKLNIMPASAWNENTVNDVKYQGESKNIIRSFI